MRGDVADWTGHVIVCGLNRVGVRTVEQLQLAGVPAVVVDDQPDARYARIVEGWGLPQLTGSPALADTLAAAGLAGAVAVVCVQDEDLDTLETALLARELRADVRVVVQIRNPAVGRALAGAGVAVFDVAGLSAPSVVGACLRTGSHHLDLGGAQFVVASAVADAVADGDAAATFRSRYGDLTPVAVAPAGGGDLVVCPGRDHPVSAGDTLSLLGTADELRAAGLSWRRESAPATRHRPGALLRRAAAPLVNAADRRLKITLAAMVALIAVSTTVLWLGYREPDGRRMSLLDALYFTIETLATVGYGDFSFRAQPTWLRVFATALMIVGAISVTVFFALLTDLLVSRRIEESLGRQRVTDLSGHVVVVGLGSIGLQVVRQLRAAGSDVVVVDNNEGNRYFAQVRAAGVPILVADATPPDTLQKANLAAASAVTVLTSDDLVNLETGLAVRDLLGPGGAEVPVVLRLFDRQLARTVERSFGFDQVRSAAALAAPWFVGAALGLDVLGTFYVESTPLLVARLTVAPAGGLDGLATQALSGRTRVLAISRAAENGRLEYPLRRDTRMRAGDRAYLVGPYEELLAVLRRDALQGSGCSGDV